MNAIYFLSNPAILEVLVRIERLVLFQLFAGARRRAEYEVVYHIQETDVWPFGNVVAAMLYGSHPITLALSLYLLRTSGGRDFT